MDWRVRNKYQPFRAVFLHGDGGRRITTGECFGDDSQGKKVMQCLLGKTKDVDYKLVANKFGVAKGGFNIVSCQFAMHYFFENKRTLNEFLRNVSENTTEGGYFIGTCYDGRAVFEKLRGSGLPIIATYQNANTGEPVQMVRIEKKYTQDVFEDDATSLGYKIDVYQETINKVFPEYLVNFTYFTRLMEEYGFKLVDTAKTNECGLGNATGMFRDLFEMMPTGSESRKLYGDAPDMSDAEKMISFLNRYFIFRKNRNAAVDIVFNKQMSMNSESDKTTVLEPSLKIATGNIVDSSTVELKNKLDSIPVQMAKESESNVGKESESSTITVVEKPEIKKTKRTYKSRKTATKQEEK
jgi:hypothetical protein